MKGDKTKTIDQYLLRTPAGIGQDCETYEYRWQSPAQCPT